MYKNIGSKKLTKLRPPLDPMFSVEKLTIVLDGTAEEKDYASGAWGIADSEPHS